MNQPAEARAPVLVGAWPRGNSKAHIALVAASRLDAQIQNSTAASTVAIAMVATPGNSVVYVAHGDGVGAWRRTGTRLEQLGEQIDAPGSMTCHLAVSADGRHLIVAHNRQSRVVVYQIASDGSILSASSSLDLVGSGPDPVRQARARPHMVVCRRNGEVLVVDLGADRVWRLQLEAGRLIRTGYIALPAGTGPRHLAIFRSVAYVVGELSNSLIAVDLDSERILGEEPCSDGPTGASAHYPSAIRITSDGRYCYVLNRGPDTVASFALDPRPRRLAETSSGGVSPWDLEFVGDGLWVANRESGTVAALPLDPDSGIPMGPTSLFSVPGAVSLLLLR